MSLADTLNKIESDNRAAVQAATFGHLAPKKGITYYGYFTFVRGCYGDETAIKDEIENLPSSPWWYDALHEYVHSALNAFPNETVLKFTGQIKVIADEIVFVGRVTKIKGEI